MTVILVSCLSKTCHINIVCTLHKVTIQGYKQGVELAADREQNIQKSKSPDDRQIFTLLTLMSLVWFNKELLTHLNK